MSNGFLQSEKIGLVLNKGIVEIHLARIISLIRGPSIEVIASADSAAMVVDLENIDAVFPHIQQVDQNHFAIKRGDKYVLI